MSDIVPKKEIKLPVEWGIDATGIEALESANKAMREIGSHGIMSAIPIICRGKTCPYLETCMIEKMGKSVEAIKGQRCPVEVSKLMKYFKEYVEQFNIDLENADRVVIGLVKELVDYEIQIERADKRMAQLGDFLEDVIVGVDANGRPIKNKEIAKPIDYKERASRKKNEILQLLNSTPKDKAGSKLNITMDPSTYAAQLLAKFNELKDAGIVNADYSVEDDDND